MARRPCPGADPHSAERTRAHAPLSLGRPTIDTVLEAHRRHESDCRCPDGGVSRRTLLKALGVGAATVTASETLTTRVAFAEPGYTGDVLVVLSLRGGFDGMSAVAPTSDPEYLKLRPSIGVPQSVLLQLDSRFGMHPAMQPLMPLWKAGRIAFVHGVGQPDPTRSHFEAMEEMERAAPGSSLRSGWLDRTLGARSHSTFTAVSFAETAPASMAGPTPELAMSSLDGFSLHGTGSAEQQRASARALAMLHRGGRDGVSTTGRLALAAAGSIRGLPATRTSARYPASELGTGLSDLARLIKAGVGVQVAAVDCGDWDMHSSMGGHDAGWMHDKLADLAAGLAAFAADLGPLLSSTTLLTLSEFGRRAAENGSGGLDHGHGNLVMLLGGGVVGGRVHGTWPGLADAQLDDGALAGVTDYRDVIGEVLQKRCGAGSLNSVFPGFRSAGDLGLVRRR